MMLIQPTTIEGKPKNYLNLQSFILWLKAHDKESVAPMCTMDCGAAISKGEYYVISCNDPIWMLRFLPHNYITECHYIDWYTRNWRDI